MNGKRYFLDTNAIILLLKGDRQIVKIVSSATWLGISVISIIEFLSFSGLTKSDSQYFSFFLKEVEIIGITFSDYNLIEEVIKFRKKYKIKTPDAIILASSKIYKAALLSMDKQLMAIAKTE